MFHDIKLNPDQLTARQVEKMCDKYKKYLEMYGEKAPEKGEEAPDAAPEEKAVQENSTPEESMSEDAGLLE